MLRAALTCLLTVAVAVPLFAQSTIAVDLQVTDGHAVNPARLRIGSQAVYSAFLHSDMPLTAETPVVLDIPGFITHVRGGGCTGTRPVVCTLGPVGSYISENIVVHTILDQAGPQTATVRVQGRETTRTVEVVDMPSLSISASTINLTGRRVDPGGLLQYQSSLVKDGAIQNVGLRYTLPNGGTFTAVRSGVVPCSLTATEIVCTVVRELDASIHIDARAPEQLTGGTVVLRAEVLYPEPDFDPTDNVAEVVTRLVRGLAVTNTNDEGSGSLRQALLDAQTLCMDAPCAVLFRIPGTAPDGVFAIRPKSALPEVRGWMKIDGATQEGARIALIGSEAGLAHGLLLGEGCELQVLNLSISGFAWPGIEAQRTFRDRACSNTDRGISEPILIAGNELRGNYRGIVLVETPNVIIRDNVIENNVRAGIFSDRAFLVQVHHNRVAGNGASGMFFNFASRDGASGAHVHDNVVVNNAEWGITRTNTGWVAIQRNAIFDNAHPAIDLNLDFETPNRPDDDLSSIPNKPVLLSAHYDPVREMTFVTGRLDTNNPASALELDFYVDDHPTRRHMGAWVASFHPETPSEFTFAIPKNLKGSYLVATTTRSRVLFAKPPDVGSNGHSTGLLTDTSEVSNAVPVQ
jgi:hypothetical protein